MLLNTPWDIFANKFRLIFLVSAHGIALADFGLRRCTKPWRYVLNKEVALATGEIS